MTDKDLRIGDVVMTNGQTYGTKRGELYIVTKIDSEVYVLRKDGKYLKGGVNITNIKRLDDRYIGGAWVDYLIPVPLTKELLLKLGFVERENKHLDSVKDYKFETDKGTIEIFSYSKYWSLYVKSIDFNYDTSMDLHYMHELQHVIWDNLHIELNTGKL